jgi:hypothetical protein
MHAGIVTQPPLYCTIARMSSFSGQCSERLSGRLVMHNSIRSIVICEFQSKGPVTLLRIVLAYASV